MVPKRPVFAPDARKIESISEVVVVFPLVPVTAISCKAFAGWLKKFAAAEGAPTSSAVTWVSASASSRLTVQVLLQLALSFGHVHPEDLLGASAAMFVVILAQSAATARAYAAKYNTKASEKWVLGFAEPHRAAPQLASNPAQVSSRSES